MQLTTTEFNMLKSSLLKRYSQAQALEATAKKYQTRYLAENLLFTRELWLYAYAINFWEHSDTAYNYLTEQQMMKILSKAGCCTSESTIGLSLGSLPLTPPVTPVPGGGGSSTFPLVKTAADFESDGVSYNNPAIVGQQLMVYVKNFNQEWQFAPEFFSYTATGIIITYPEFNMANYPSITIQNYNP